MQVYIQEDAGQSLRTAGWSLKHTAVALGGFDAMHIGHQAIIKRVVAHARAHGLTSVVCLFRNQPRSVLQGVEAPMVHPLEKRLELLEALGVDVVIAEWFTKAYSEISPEVFVFDRLRDWLGAEFVAAGFNYRFGRYGAGNPQTLKQLGAQAGITVFEEGCVELDGAPISSSRIRTLIGAGRMEEAAVCLGRQFSIRGQVLEGNRIGRGIGFPTANLDCPKGLLLPKHGVYLTRAKAGERWYSAITNVGRRPTVQGEIPRVETHLLEFSGDLYGTELEVAFYQYLRGIKTFPNLEALKAQLQTDRQRAEVYFA